MTPKLPQKNTLAFVVTLTLCVCAGWPTQASARPRTSVGISFYSGPGCVYPRYYEPYYYGPSYSREVYATRPTVVYSAPPAYVLPPPVYYGSPVPSAAYPYDSYSVAPAPRPLIDTRLVQVQDNLRRLGYYRGVVDGIIGEGTRSAIRSYQIDRGLPVSGRVDRALLQDLGL